MKKLMLVLSGLGIALNSYAVLPTTPFGVNVPSFCGGFTFGVYGLYWRPSTPHYDYVLSVPDFSAFETPRHFSVDSNYDWGFKVNIGYVFPCAASDVKLAYTYFNHDFTNRADIPDNGSLMPTLTDAWPAFALVPPFDFTVLASPGFTVISPNPVSVFATAFFDPEFADAKSSFEHSAADLEFGQSVNLGCNMQFRLFGGLRYAKVQNTLDVIYQRNFLGTPVTFTGVAPFVFEGAGGVVDATAIVNVTAEVTGQIHEIVNQKSNWQGWGPRLGFDARYDIAKGLGVVASVSTSLMVGEAESALYELYDASLLEVVTAVDAIIPPIITAAEIGIAPGTLTGFAATQNLSFQHPDITRVVPNIDGKFGLTYAFNFCNCTRTRIIVEAGYAVTHYFNVIDRLSAVAADSPEFRIQNTVDASFDGLYFGVQVKV